MKKNQKKILATSLIIAGLLFFVFVNKFALAQVGVGQIGLEEIGDTAYGVKSPDQAQDIRVTIVKIINVALQILGILVVVLIIFSGYQWMTSGGNEEQVKKAQSRIVNAVIGLVIILAAWGVTIFVLNSLLKATAGGGGGGITPGAPGDIVPYDPNSAQKINNLFNV